MALSLQFEPLWRVGNALAAVVAAVDPGIRSAPDLIDRHIVVHPLAVKVHRHQRFLGHLAVFKTRCAKDDVISVPFSQTVIGMIRRFGFVDHRAHAVLSFVAILSIWIS